MAKLTVVKDDIDQKVRCSIMTNQDKWQPGYSPDTKQLEAHPDKYVSPLEITTAVTSTDAVDHLQHTCLAPIDTYRARIIRFEITSADKKQSRHLDVRVARNGCKEGLLFWRGICRPDCPTYTYSQPWNRRCGTCNQHCELCTDFYHCQACQPPDTLNGLSFILSQDGGCVVTGAARRYVRIVVALAIIVLFIGFLLVSCRVKNAHSVLAMPRKPMGG